MPVRRLLERLGVADRLDCAWLVLDDDAPAFRLGDLARNQAHYDIRRRAGSTWDNEADHPGRIGLCGSGQCKCDQTQCDEQPSKI